MIDPYIVGSKGVLAMLLCVCIGCEFSDAPSPSAASSRAGRQSATPIPLAAIEIPSRTVVQPTVLKGESIDPNSPDRSDLPPRPRARLPETSQQPAELPKAVSFRPSTTAAPSIARGQLAFVDGYAAGLQRAASEGKPLMLFFTARWCTYCHQMADEAFTDPQLIVWSQRFVCVVIDADADRATCQRYGVKTYPTLQFATPLGVPLNRLVGKRAAPEVVGQMQFVLQPQMARP